MKTFLTVFILSAVLLAICFALIAVKIIFKKNGEFKRHCASIDPYTGERVGCMCGHSNIKTSKCSSEGKTHSVLEVDSDLLRDALDD